MEQKFEFVIRNKIRFPYKGSIGVEDLYDLSVRELDSIFKTLNAQVKRAQEESLLTTKSKEDEVLAIQIDIIKHIVDVKMAEAAAAEQSKKNKEQRQKIMEIMAEKKDANLRNMSIEDLQAMLDNLN